MKWLIILLSFFSSHALMGQSWSGSFETVNSSDYISSGTYKFIYSESLYLGPQTSWDIEGEVHIYSRNIWVSPLARISGGGTLYIHSPGDNPFYEGLSDSPTVIDGNDGLFIGVNIVLTNSLGIVLDDISVPDYASGPTSDVRSAALKIGKSLDLRVDGASIYLNGYDLEFSETGDLLNYNLHRMVVTGDHLTGHMIKNYTGISTFFFPVGVEQGDYTPARLVPWGANSCIHVSVNTYGAVPNLNIPDEEIGMDRVWNIFADQSMQMDYTLTHNRQTNGVAYVDAEARIVQNADGGNWIGDVTVLDGEGIHTRADIATRAGNTLSGTWFTKLNDQVGPTAVNDEGALEYGSNITINVLENDMPGSSAIDRGSVRIVTPPNHGNVVVNRDGSVTYVPHDGFVGEDTFVYEITDENGLTSTAVVTVIVLPRELFIPNIITPNGDGKNDRFVIIGRENYDRIEVTIMNRWGNEVYRSDDYQDEWDGSGLNDGTYYPLIRAIKGDQERVFKGFVMIKRY